MIGSFFYIKKLSSQAPPVLRMNFVSIPYWNHGPLPWDNQTRRHVYMATLALCETTTPEL